jgi:hypothetical protein
MNAWNMALRGLRRGAIVGLVLGALYSFGGLIIDLMTIGLNQGTALAFLALLGMPAIFGIAGLCISLILGLFEQG